MRVKEVTTKLPHTNPIKAEAEEINSMSNYEPTKKCVEEMFILDFKYHNQLIREAIKKKKSQSWDIVPTSAEPPSPLPNLGRLIWSKNFIAYFNSTASETDFKHGFNIPF